MHCVRNHRTRQVDAFWRVHHHPSPSPSHCLPSHARKCIGWRGDVMYSILTSHLVVGVIITIIGPCLTWQLQFLQSIVISWVFLRSSFVAWSLHGHVGEAGWWQPRQRVGSSHVTVIMTRFLQNTLSGSLLPASWYPLAPRYASGCRRCLVVGPSGFAPRPRSPCAGMMTRMKTPKGAGGRGKLGSHITSCHNSTA